MAKVNKVSKNHHPHSTPILSVSELGKTLTSGENTLQILSNICFSLNSGDSLAVVGISGSGKSTLLGILAGLDLPTTGKVQLCGTELTQLDEDGRADVRGKNVGFVFQSFQLLPNLTACENVLLPLEVLGKKNGLALAKEWLQRVGLGSRLNHYPRQLSGGEQQRVAIARAFISQANILFADEPTGNLDSKTGSTIIDLLFQLNEEQNTTLVLVTHDSKLANRCDYQLELREGEAQWHSRQP